MGRYRADTFAQSHIKSTATNAGAAADKAACSKTKKYEHLSITHNFIPFALETGGSWNSEAIELTIKRHRKENHRDQLRTTRDKIPVSTDFHRNPERQCPGVSEHIPK